MMTRKWQTRALIAVCAFVVSTMAIPAAADAQIVRVSRADHRSTIGFNLGYFFLRGEDARDNNDVIRTNVFDGLFRSLDTNDLLAVNDFNAFTFGGEWTYAVSEYLETGVGLGFYRKTVPTIYDDFEDTDGSDIAQQFRLRVVPITATVRFLPVGRGGAIEPYVGAGLGIFNWRYSETGEFIDFRDFRIFRESFSANGNAIGPVVLAGLRAPVGDLWLVGGEIRWQRAEGDTDPDRSELLGDRIDLGGWTTSFTVHFRF